MLSVRFRRMDVPTIDALNVFICCQAYQDSLKLDVNKDIMNIMISSLRMFKKLKYITFKFTYDEDIDKTYKLLLLKDKKKLIKRYIYNVDKMEFNLADMFSQRIIDMLNKIFICNDQIPNSYLDRKFLLDYLSMHQWQSSYLLQLSWNQNLLSRES